MLENVEEGLKNFEGAVVLEHPYLRELINNGNLPNGLAIPAWHKMFVGDYVNALVLNEAGQAMIFEHGANGVGKFCWQIVGGYLGKGEDPMTAVKRALLEDTGYASEQWTYLSSYTIDAEQKMGVGHFFCARDVRQIAQPTRNHQHKREIKWVSRRDLKYALLDGRIPTLSYAFTISMALLTVVH